MFYILHSIGVHNSNLLQFLCLVSKPPYKFGRIHANLYQIIVGFVALIPLQYDVKQH